MTKNGAKPRHLTNDSLIVPEVTLSIPMPEGAAIPANDPTVDFGIGHIGTEP